MTATRKHGLPCDWLGGSVEAGAWCLGWQRWRRLQGRALAGERRG